MYYLSPTYELQISKPYYSRVREKAYTITALERIQKYHKREI